MTAPSRQAATAADVGAGHTHPLHVHGHTAVHHLPAHVKIGAVFAYAVAVALTPVGAWPAFLVLGLLALLAVGAARLPAGFVLSRMVVVAPFVLSGLLVPFVATGHDASWGPLTWSTEGLAAGLSIALRAALGVTASIVLVGTTELPRLLAGLERLHVPATLVAIASFMLRYLELVADELGRMRMAMTARGHDPRWLWQVRPMAAASGALFVRTFERGERVHLGMQARGFTGRMPTRDTPAVRIGDLALVVPWATAALAAAVIARFA